MLTRKLINRLLILFFSAGVWLLNSCNEHCEPPQNTISSDYAKILKNKYISEREGLLTESLGFRDYREFTFQLDTIKQYIKYVESFAKENGYDGLGLRITLGVYPEETSKKNGQVRANRTTVYIAPTATSFPTDQYVSKLVRESHVIDEALDLNFGGLGP